MDNPSQIQLKEWKPTHRQNAVLQLPDSIFECLYGGAAGGGKTELLFMLPIARGFYQNPRFKGMILRRTYPELESEVILRTREYYPSTGAKYNEQKKRWEWPWGAILSFGHAEHLNDIRKYDSLQLNYAAFDELTHFLEFQYLYLAASRVRSSDSSLPAIVRSGSNPGGPGHGHVRSRFVEPHREGNRIIRDTRTGTKRIYIPSKLTDNPHILKSDPTYGQRLLNLPNEAERRAKLEGDWWTYEGQVFAFREEPLPGEPSNACHVIEPFEIPEWWPKILAIDWGFRAATVALWGAISPENRLYIYREYHVKEKLVSDWGYEIAYQSANELDSIKAVVIDPSAAKRTGGAETILEQFNRASGMRASLADNDRVSGKVLLQEMFSWEPKQKLVKEVSHTYDPEVAAYILRNQGPDAYHKYLNDLTQTGEDTQIRPVVQIFNTCTNLINCIPLCAYDETNKEDVAAFEGDDSYDTVRYLAKAARRYMDGKVSSESPTAQVDRAIQRLKETEDMTSYYMHMRRIESDLRKKSYGVRRHRARIH